MSPNKKIKFYALFGLCLVVILGLWFYSLKLNLSKPNGDQGKFDLNLGEIFSDLSDTFKNIPPAPKFSTSTPATNQAIDNLAEKLKQLENTSTADWLTYTNKELNFEFKYPKTWKVDGSRSSKNEIVFDTGAGDTESRESITVANANNKNLDYWKSTFENILSTKKTIIDGKDAYELSSSEFGISYIIVINGDKLYTITSTGALINSNILSTFKFIK